GTPCVRAARAISCSQGPFARTAVAKLQIESASIAIRPTLFVLVSLRRFDELVMPLPVVARPSLRIVGLPFRGSVAEQRSAVRLLRLLLVRLRMGMASVRICVAAGAVIDRGNV